MKQQQACGSLLPKNHFWSCLSITKKELRNSATYSWGSYQETYKTTGEYWLDAVWFRTRMWNYKTLFILREIPETHSAKTKILHFAFVDLEKAFVWVPTMLNSGLWGN